MDKNSVDRQLRELEDALRQAREERERRAQRKRIISGPREVVIEKSNESKGDLDESSTNKST